MRIESAAKALELQGRSLLDNTISDAELESLFSLFDGRSSKELDKFTEIFFKHVDDQVLYQLTQRLASLEVKFNGSNNQFLRNKSLAKVCILEVARREKFSEGYLQALFPYCKEFFALEKKIPSMLSNIFKAIFKQLRDCNQDITTQSLGMVFVFNVVNTLLIKETNSYKPGQQLALVCFIKGIFNVANSDFEGYLKDVVDRIDSCLQEPTFVPEKDARSLDDMNTLLQLDVAQSQGVAVSADFITWSRDFRKLSSTAEMERAATQTQILATFDFHQGLLSGVMSESKVMRILADIEGMLIAFKNNQSHNFTQEVSECAVKVLMELNSKVINMQCNGVIDEDIAKKLSGEIIHTAKQIYQLQVSGVQPSALKY